MKNSDRPVRVEKGYTGTPGSAGTSFARQTVSRFYFRVVEEGQLRSFGDWHPCTELVIPELAWEGKDMLCIAVVFSTHCLLYTFAFPLDNFSVDSCSRSGIYRCIFDLLCDAGMHSWNTKLSPSRMEGEHGRLLQEAQFQSSSSTAAAEPAKSVPKCF